MTVKNARIIEAWRNGPYLCTRKTKDSMPVIIKKPSFKRKLKSILYGTEKRKTTSRVDERRPEPHQYSMHSSNAAILNIALSSFQHLEDKTPMH